MHIVTPSVRCPSIRSCTRSRSASYTRSRSRSPSYSRSSPSHETYIPVWKRQFAQVPGYQKDFLRNIVSCLKSMPNLDKFFEGCEIPPMFGEMPRKTAKLNLLKWLSIQLLSKLYAYCDLVIISHYTGKLSIYKLALRT